MTDILLAMVPQYGLYLIGTATFLSCLAVPIPSSLIMLSAGAFVAAGDLGLAPVAVLAFGGAVLGDQLGYLIGARGGAMLTRFGEGGKAAELMLRARKMADRWGGLGVFLSRWLFSPLGPYMNFATGAAGMDWPRFALWGAAGEMVWVGVYVGLGYGFGAHIEMVANILGSFSGTLAAGAITLGLGIWLRAALRADRGALPHEPR